jgi:hypothetical protein
MQRADDPLPPVIHEHSRSPVTGLVVVNSDHFNEAQRRQIDNIGAHVGVWLTVIGGIIASVMPFPCALFDVWTPATFIYSRYIDPRPVSGPLSCVRLFLNLRHEFADTAALRIIHL